MALANSVRTANLNAQSRVGDIDVAYLSASIQSSGSITISISIGNISAYASNKNAVDADIEAFKADAIKTAQGSQEE